MNPEEDNDRSTDSTFDNTRRQFVAGTAGAVSGLAIGSGLVTPSLAQEDDEEDDGEDAEEGEEEEEEPIQNEFEDDIDLLNYALTLERLEASFYQQGLENISEEEFARYNYFGPEGSDLRDRALEELETIRSHEEQHAETLAQTIEDLGGTPAEEPEFDFGIRVEFPGVFLFTAAQFEDLGVAAYAGAAPFIQNDDLVAPALGIHSVEARHASFLRTLTNQTSFPNVIDEPMSRSEVMEIAGQYVVEEGEGSDGEEGETDDGEEGETDNGEEGETDNGEDGGTDDGGTDDGTEDDDVEGGDDSTDDGTGDNETGA